MDGWMDGWIHTCIASQAFLKTHDMNALLRWPRMVVASSGFRFPFFKQLIELSNCVPATLQKVHQPSQASHVSHLP